MIKKAIIEQRLVIVEENGHSRQLTGELEENRFGKMTDDILPAYLNMGWQVVKMTPFYHSSSVLVLLQREPGL
ncbi:MAG: hypothetical protein HQL32_10020 [Planctomycetes bacterium]|nr:hypothetical protein [Planctomycetota bacterium]